MKNPTFRYDPKQLSKWINASASAASRTGLGTTAGGQPRVLGQGRRW